MRDRTMQRRAVQKRRPSFKATFFKRSFVRKALGGGRTQPRIRPVPRRRKHRPQFSEPVQGQQLRFDGPEQPLHDQQADGIEGQKHPCTGQPVTLACDDQGYKLQGFNRQQGHEQQCQRPIGSKLLNSAACSGKEREPSLAARAAESRHQALKPRGGGALAAQ